MSTLIFDIETIGENFDELDETTQEILTRWIKQNAKGESEYEVEFQALKEGLGLSPLTGEIVAIGLLHADKEEGAVYFQSPGRDVAEVENGIKFKSLNERDMLEQFWTVMKSCDELVGFNSRSFDLPFLMLRSAINGIHPTKNFLKGRYLYQQDKSARHIDLLDQLTFEGAVWKNKGNLHTYCRAFGIESPKAGVSGDDVSGLFKNRKYFDIARYNVGDLRATKELYERWKTYLRF